MEQKIATNDREMVIMRNDYEKVMHNENRIY